MEEPEGKKRRRCKKTTDKLEQLEDESESSESDIFDPNDVKDPLPTDKNRLKSMLLEVEHKMKIYKGEYFKESKQITSTPYLIKNKNHMWVIMRFPYVRM